MDINESIDRIAKLANEIDNVELNDSISELQSQLHELLAECQEKDSTIEDQLKEIDELRKKLSFSRKLERGGDAYFEVDANGKCFGDPYCSSCWETDKIAVLMKNRVYRFCCPRCDKTVSTTDIRRIKR